MNDFRANVEVSCRQAQSRTLTYNVLVLRTRVLPSSPVGSTRPTERKNRLIMRDAILPLIH